MYLFNITHNLYLLKILYIPPAFKSYSLYLFSSFLKIKASVFKAVNFFTISISSSTPSEVSTLIYFKN